MAMPPIGENVVVRTHGDKARIARIWDYGDDAVFICTNSQYQRFISTGDTPPSAQIGFPLEDVYYFEEKTDIEAVDWQNMRPITSG